MFNFIYAIGTFLTNTTIKSLHVDNADILNAEYSVANASNELWIEPAAVEGIENGRTVFSL